MRYFLHSGTLSGPELKQNSLVTQRATGLYTTIALRVSVSGMFLSPQEISPVPMHDRRMHLPIPVETLASALANASPSEHRTMLGENLYPLAEQLERGMAAKVTGMCPEMDQTEVLHLLESPESLRAKVAEAMQVLGNASAQQPC